MRVCNAKVGQIVVFTRGTHKGQRATVTAVEKYGLIVARPGDPSFFIPAEYVEPEGTDKPDLKAGDRVRYVGNVDKFKGAVGTALNVSQDFMTVKFDNHAISHVAPAQLFEPVTETSVYAGKPDLVHIPNGKRQGVGRLIANAADALIREAALRSDGKDGDLYDPLCPGCYMVAVFNAAVALAEANGQSLTELGRCMAKAFNDLETKGISAREDIEVSLDHC